jgi:hypothetical protein
LRIAAVSSDSEFAYVQIVMLHELTRKFRVRHTTGAVQIAQRGPNHLLRWRMVRPEIAETVRIGLKDNLAAA